MDVLTAIFVFKALTALDGLEPTALDPGAELVLAATEVRYIEARWPETVVRGRPWVPHRRIATIVAGTRLVVRGTVDSRDEAGCHGKAWYAVHPFGFVCSEHARPTDRPPEPGPALPVDDGERLPFSYAIVRNDDVPAYRSAEAVELGEPERTLGKKMSLAILRSREIGGVRYLETLDGLLVQKSDVGWMGQGSDWQGVDLDGPSRGPLFAWANRKPTRTYDKPNLDANRRDDLKRRERVPLLQAIERDGSVTWWRIGDDRWVRAKDVNEVHVTPIPEGVISDYRIRSAGNDQWIDVDLGEQVLVAYRGDQAVYATLVSSGRRTATPRGNYPIWAKVASMDMSNQDYEDEPYLVQGVPWVLLFQGHNALHGAYWHNRFGNRKSHGCVNLAPLDAKWVFEWVSPVLPDGWTGYLPSDLERSAVVHVRDSSRAPGERFTQDRQVGPPDPEEERDKLEAAEERRAQLQVEQALALNPEHENLDDPPDASQRLEPPKPPELVPANIVDPADDGHGR